MSGLNPKSSITTLDTDLSPEVQKQDTNSQAELLTTALPATVARGWDIAYEWAEKNNLLKELVKVISTCLILNKPQTFGCILEQITSDNALALLEGWKETDQAAALLYKLALSAVNNKHLLSSYPPPTKGVSAAKQLRGELQAHYLIALLVEQLPMGTPKEREWFGLLRLWVLTHAINRSFTKNYQDNYLRVVSDKLRMACSDDTEWKKIFLYLHTSSALNDFDELNRLLIDKADRANKNRKQPSISDTHRVLFRNLKSVARRDHNVDLRFSKSEFLVLNDDLKVTNPPLNNTPRLDKLVDGEDVALTISGEPDKDGMEDGSIVAQVAVDENQSYVHQRLEAGRIFLATTEELQFLPYSWGKPNQFEIAALLSWVNQKLSSGDEGTKTLAAIIWLAVQTAQSLRRAMDIRFTSEISREWAIDINSLLLHRTPPQRLPGWQPKNDDELRWIKAPANKFSIALPISLKTILRRYLKSNASIAQVGDIWDSRWGKSPEEIFRESLKIVAHRVTPGMLAGALPQQVFVKSRDHVLTRLITSHPNTALSGACSYRGWSFAELRPILSGTLPDMPVETNAIEKRNVLGSQLEPVESLLIDAISNASAKAKKFRQQNDPIAFHNAFTAYVTVMLLAASGARPISDPFEKLAHFDFTEGFVFIDDKTSSHIHQGRLVVLTDEICKYIQVDYLAHLRKISFAIHEVNPKLAEDINGIATGSNAEVMPFMFFITEGATGWKSVSEKSITETGLFDWPLPLNLFRHRLARKLRHLDVDPELIDSVMGHADGATPTHGDYSFRNWDEDMRGVRPHMENLFKKLGFEMISGWRGMAMCAPERNSHTPVPSTNKVTLFGAALRKQEREQRKQDALRDASRQIRQFINERTLTELSAEEIEALSNQLLFRSNGLLHPQGYFKYQYFIKILERLGRWKGKSVRFKKRYILAQEEASHFTEGASGALSLFQELRAKLAALTPIIMRAKLSQKVSADVALIYLNLENRITSSELIKDVLHHKCIRMVTLKDSVYLEHSRNVKAILIDVPVQRYLISANSALHLDTILSAKISQPFTDHTVPEPLLPLADILIRHKYIETNATITKFYDAICKVVDQVNMMTMPGIVAGYLAGRVESYSLMWRDFTRLTLGYSVDTPIASDEEVKDVDEVAKPQLTAQAVAIHPNGIDYILLQQGANSLMNGFDKLLAEYRSKKSGPYATQDRKELQRAMNSMLEEHRGKISSAMQLLALWICSLLQRKNRNGFISLDSIKRYKSALNTPFVDIGYAQDILSMDDDDVTSFYTDLFDSLEVQDTQYVADRLADFHRWAKQNYAVEDPDWSELPATFSSAHVSPGIITEEEYQRALKLLMGKSISNTREQVAPAFLLLLCYRFGLRSGEALGLIRDDWQDYGDLIVVLVQNNSMRRLKTQTSRRQVPLVFHLSNLEKEIISQWMTLIAAQSGNNMSDGLFFKGKKEYQPGSRNLIKSHVISSLKIATNNPQITLHHARHAAANRVGIGMCGIEVSQWRMHLQSTHSQENLVENILLGAGGPTRRKIWALGRYLGHVRRSTTTKNYIHFLSELADGFVEPIIESEPSTLLHAIKLDEFPRAADISCDLLITHKYVEPTPSLMLQFFRLLSLGKPAHEASYALGLDEKYIELCCRVLDKVDSKMRLSKTKFTQDQQALTPLEFLRRLKEPAWNRLIKYAENIDKAKSDLMVSSLTSEGVIIEMIGETRQLVMWEPQHFQIVKLFIEYFGIDESRFLVVHSNQCDERVLDMSHADGFKSISRTEAAHNGKKLKIDPAVAGLNCNRVEKRCALIYSENDKFEIRNRIEFAVVYIAFSMLLTLKN